MVKNKEKKIKGTLYHREMYKEHGSVRFIEKPQTRSSKIKTTLGAGITSISLAMFIYSYGPIVSKSLTFTSTSENKIETVIEARAEDKDRETSSQSYVLVIPSLGIKSEIITNVDYTDELLYSEALTKGVAQAKGTALPGEGKRIFLFAHSTNSLTLIQQFNAVFYDLDKVKMGEKIDVQHGSNIFQYEVIEKKIVRSGDTSYIEPKDGEELILQTCWPKGTNWKRLLVFAKPI